MGLFLHTRLALLEEGGERRARRRLREERAKMTALDTQLRLDRRGMGALEQRLGEAHGFRRHGGEPARFLPPGLHRFGRGHDAGDESSLAGFLRSKRLAAQE